MLMGVILLLEVFVVVGLAGIGAGKMKLEKPSTLTKRSVGLPSIPANPEEPTGVVVDEKDAKVSANHTFLSNVKWSSISMPWESGFMKNIFGEDVLGLSTDLRQDASWIEAVTHVPVSTIAADSSNPASSGPELKPAL